MVKCLHVHPTQNHKGNGRFAGQNEIFFASYFVRRHPLPGGKLNSAVIMICGRVGIKPFGAQRTPKITSAALLAPFHEDNGSNVANVWSFVLPGTPSSTAVFPCGTKTTSWVLFSTHACGLSGCGSGTISWYITWVFGNWVNRWATRLSTVERWPLNSTNEECNGWNKTSFSWLYCSFGARCL